MRNTAPTKLLARSSLALALALVLWAPVQAQPASPAEGKTMMDGRMMAPHQTMSESQQGMMQRHQAIMADMKAQDTELSALVAKMNSAPSGKKLDLLAAIVTRMAEQRTAMNARMGTMQGELMQCTMESMPMGANSSSPHSMMKGMNGKMDAAKK